MRKSLLGVAAIAILAAAGCTANGGMPAPRLTFNNYEAIPLHVRSSTVEEALINSNDPDNVAGQFVIAPGEAVRRYAAKRFQAEGTGNGFFTIAIEDSRVHMRQITQDNKVLKWSGVGQEDEYHVYLQLRVTPQPDNFNGRAAATTIKMDRTLVMPSSVSVEDREMRQIAFLEKLIADVDVKINDALSAIPAIR